jgi:hypothetical protein
MSPVLAANLAELDLLREYLESCVERIKGLPPAEQVGTLLGMCGVSADRIKYALQHIKESP